MSGTVTKLMTDRRHQGLVYILLIDSEIEQVVFLSKSGDQWNYEDFDGREAVVPLPEINCRLAMADAYRDVVMPPTS